MFSNSTGILLIRLPSFQTFKMMRFSEKLKTVTKSQLKQLKRGRQEASVITKETLDDTLAIANTMADRDELLRYYTPARVDDSGEIALVQYTPKQMEMNVNVKRREQHNQML